MTTHEFEDTDRSAFIDRLLDDARPRTVYSNTDWIVEAGIPEKIAEFDEATGTGVTAPAAREAPPHTHDGSFACRSWHLAVRTHRGDIVDITCADLDQLRLPPGWRIT